MSKFHTLKIQQLDKITEKAVKISFDVPKDLEADYQFKAGQYITIKKKLDGEEIRRDYSICSPAHGDKLEVAVKVFEKGRFSSYANTVLEVGDSLEVSLPHGRFVLETDPNNDRTVVAFAAGSGITPIMSIIKTLLAEEPKSKMVLVYGNKHVKDAMFFNDLLTLQLYYPKRFGLNFVYSQTEEDNALFGRIDKSVVNYVVKNKYKEEAFDSFYICGPEGMINTVKDVLIEDGITQDRIHFELFTTTSTIETKPVASDGDTNVTVILDDEETSFTMSRGQTILEAALKNNIDAPYSCQGGVCCSCMARLKEGEATMIQNSVLTDGEIAEGLILTCQAQPTTSTIIVDYDDI